MEENSLRLILLGVGVIILVGIYVYDVVQKKARRQSEVVDGPIISGKAPFSAAVVDEEIADAQQAKTSEKVSEADENATTPHTEQALVVQLTVIAKSGSSMTGTALQNAFTALDLKFGDMGIFHRYERHDGVEIKRFHVANILEPGTFPISSMADFESTGVVLFFQASDSPNPEQVFESMLNTAKQLSQILGATLAGSNMKDLTLKDISVIQSQLGDMPN
ncbi:MAG: hypothetical protein A6F72_05175 [Cycloclasticus sp. symbiont of Poecilosclerida sp. N]|nr:MAG: hypothetical protein A6F72_05175 [Cycloclasticus sp. symbiont of Poecilosclerida sp. N]